MDSNALRLWSSATTRRNDVAIKSRVTARNRICLARATLRQVLRRQTSSRQTS
jgi:hypothetical protein